MDLNEYSEGDKKSLLQVNDQVYSQAGRNYPKKEIGKLKSAKELKGEKQKTTDSLNNGRKDSGEFCKEKKVSPKQVKTNPQTALIDIKPVEKVRQEIQEIIDSLDEIRFDFSDIFDEEEDSQTSLQPTLY